MLQEKHLFLTQPQFAVLKILLKLPMGQEISTGFIGKKLKMNKHYIKNYLNQRLMGLYNRGFLCKRLASRKAYWSLGPMVDALKDQGVIK